MGCGEVRILKPIGSIPIGAWCKTLSLKCYAVELSMVLQCIETRRYVRFKKVYTSQSMAGVNFFS